MRGPLQQSFVGIADGVHFLWPKSTQVCGETRDVLVLLSSERPLAPRSGFGAARIGELMGLPVRGTANEVPSDARARRVMIVDDHEEVRASLACLVRDWGHDVIVAADGVTALSLAEAFQPDCAVVDLSMRGMTGIELGRRLRQRFSPAQLRLIALSGYAGVDIRDACRAAGFSAYLVKPGDIPELEQLLGSDDGNPDAPPH